MVTLAIVLACLSVGYTLVVNWMAIRLQKRLSIIEEQVWKMYLEIDSVIYLVSSTALRSKGTTTKH